MKTIHFFTTIITVNILILLCHSTPRSEGIQQQSSIHYNNIWRGLWETFPILNEHELEEMNKREKDIPRRITQLANEKKIFQSRLASIISYNTVKVKPHLTFFGGLFTIPSLSEAEKKSKDLRKTIQKEKEYITNEIDKIENEIKDLKQELIDIGKLIEENKTYVEKRILWGFIAWQEKKH